MSSNSGFCAPQKPRVLYLHEFSRMGGAEVALLRLVDAIRPMGVEPVVLWPQHDDTFERLSFRGHPVVRLKVPPWRHGLSLPLLPWFLVRLRRAGATKRLDLVHVNNYRSAPVGFLVARRLGLPCVCTVREQVAPEKVRQYRLQGPDALIAVCDAVSQNLVEGGIAVDRVTTIRSGVAVAAASHDQERRELRERVGVAADDPLLGIVAHIQPHKGYDDLIRALGLIAQQVPRVKCLVMGEAPRRQYLSHLLELAERLAVRDRLILVGPQENVATFFNGMDLFILPSHTEGLPLTVLEAMAAGKPVVATAVGGIPEAVIHGKSGFIVPPHDPQRLAAAVTDVLKCSALLKSMGEVGRQTVIEAFTLEHEAEQTAKLYRRILLPTPSSAHHARRAASNGGSLSKPR